MCDDAVERRCLVYDEDGCLVRTVSVGWGPHPYVCVFRSRGHVTCYLVDLCLCVYGGVTSLCDSPSCVVGDMMCPCSDHSVMVARYVHVL